MATGRTVDGQTGRWGRALQGARVQAGRADRRAGRRAISPNRAKIVHSAILAREKEQQSNRRYQTSPALCNHALSSIYFLNLSPIIAKLTSLS